MTAKNITRILFVLLIAVEVVGWAGGLPWTPTYSWLGLILTALAVWACVEWFQPPAELWPLFFFGLCMDAVADTFQFYYHVESWDRMMHLIGGALIALVSWHAVRRVLPETTTVRWRILLVLSMVAFFGTLYEGAEFGIDSFYIATEGQSRGALGTGPDTVDDQLLNIIGGLVVVGIAEYRRRR